MVYYGILDEHAAFFLRVTVWLRWMQKQLGRRKCIGRQRRGVACTKSVGLGEGM